MTSRPLKDNTLMDWRSVEWDTPRKDGEDYARLSGDRGGYTFHRVFTPIDDDLNLSHPITQTVHEQLSDLSFHREWQYYRLTNEQAANEYDVRNHNIERAEKKWDERHRSA